MSGPFAFLPLRCDPKLMKSISNVRLHLHVDGLALFAAGLVGYILAGGSWWLFVLLLLAPDLVMLGYLAGPRIGARVYNAGHSLVVPVVLGAIGMIPLVSNAARAEAQAPFLVLLALIWTAHLGMDRIFGFGYKYPSAFRDTHFARV